MKILVDADACPVKEIIEKVGKEYGIPIIMLIDTSHILTSDYSQILTVSKGPDAVDLALINRLNAHDIAVTQDYGVAAMALGKGAYAIHQSGKQYTNNNIEQMLFERHLAKKERQKEKKHSFKHISKRTREDDERFEKSFRSLCTYALNNLPHTKTDH